MANDGSVGLEPSDWGARAADQYEAPSGHGVAELDESLGAFFESFAAPRADTPTHATDHPVSGAGGSETESARVTFAPAATQPLGGESTARTMADARAVSSSRPSKRRRGLAPVPVVPVQYAMRIIQAHAINPDTVRFNPPRARDMGQILTDRLQARLWELHRPVDPFSGAAPSPYASTQTRTRFNALVARGGDLASEFELCGDTTLPIGTRGFVTRMIDRVAGYAELEKFASESDPSWDMIIESRRRAKLDTDARADHGSANCVAFAALDEGGSLDGGAFPVGASVPSDGSGGVPSLDGSAPASMSSASSGSSGGKRPMPTQHSVPTRHASAQWAASNPYHGFYQAYTAYNGNADDPRLVLYSMTCSSVEFIGDTECKDTPKETVTLQVQLRGTGLRPVAVYEAGKLVQLRIPAFVLALNAPCASRLRYRYAPRAKIGAARSSGILPGARIGGQRMRGMVIVDSADPTEPLSRVRLECAPVNMRDAPRYIFTVSEDGIHRIQTQCLRLKRALQSGTDAPAEGPQSRLRPHSADGDNDDSEQHSA